MTLGNRKYRDPPAKPSDSWNVEDEANLYSRPQTEKMVYTGELNFRQGIEVETGIPEHTENLRREGTHLWLH